MTLANELAIGAVVLMSGLPAGAPGAVMLNRVAGRPPSGGRGEVCGLSSGRRR